MRVAITGQSRQWWRILMFVSIGVIALGLRLFFIFNVSQVEIVWDTRLYWDATRQVRNFWCETLSICTPDIRERITFSDVMTFAYSREGVLPIIMGGLLAFLPAEPNTAYIIHALLDALTCLMVVHIAWRLTHRLWVAFLAGLLIATYVPVITNTGTMLQQPLLRFSLTVVIWAYAQIFTTETMSRRTIVIWTGMGTFASVLIGFGSITTRPLIWITFASVIGIAIIYRKHEYMRTLLWSQLAFVGVTFGILALLFAISNPEDPSDTVSRIAVGLSAQGTAQDQTTVMSFEHFWPPSSWQTAVDNQTESLFGDIARDPVQFTYWSAYGLFSNYRYPDYAYLQEFGLTLTQQRLQHTLLLIFALVGVAWWLGQRGSYQPMWSLLLMIIAYLSVIYSVISPEPRRMSIMAPIWALAAAISIWQLLKFRHTIRQWRWWEIALPLITLSAWITPISLLAITLPINIAYVLLVLLRTVLLLTSGLILVSKWSTQDEQFLRPVSTVFIVSIVGFIGVAQLQDQEWRVFNTKLEIPARQTINNITPYDHLHPWLIIDLASPEQAQNVTILINDQVVKPGGSPMFRWQAGIPAEWSPYGTLRTMANFDADWRVWYAVPLAQNVLNNDTLTIDIIPNGEPMMLRGDFVSDDENYFGPLFSPWYTGHSFWRLMWNADDPRIPAEQTLNGTYHSSVAYTNVTDLYRFEFAGKTRLLHRVFITQAAFSHNTNAFGAPLASNASELCPQSTLLMAPGNTPYYICKEVDNSIGYYTEGIHLGESHIEIFQENLEENTLIDQIIHNNGHIDIVQVQINLFVANFYDVEGNLTYAMVFSV